MISTSRTAAFFLVLLMVRYSVGLPALPIVNQLLCTSCEITELTTIDIPCISRGLDFAVQPHDYENNDVNYSDLVVEHFRATPPIQTGYTKSIGWVAPDPNVKYSIYGGPAIQAEYKGVNHRAYFLPPVSGTYTVTATTYDDAFLLWVGDTAKYGNYSRDDADLVAVKGTDPLSYKFWAEGKQPRAIRMLFVNSIGAANFRISISNPDGTVFFDSHAVAETPFFIPFSCKVWAPPFKPWGKELDDQVDEGAERE